MNTFEPWVLDWVNEQRRKGAKGLEVKYLNKNYYVYRSTSYRDRNLRKVRKKSTYIGRLDRERGLIQSSQKYRSNVYPKSVKTYGDAMLLNIALKDLIPLLKENFDFWEDIYALALVRIYGYVPLKRARLRWEKLHNPFNINPNLEPKHLSDVLEIIGSDKISQNNIFRSLLTGSENFAYDISAIVTRSSINISDIGYNKEMSYAPQIELILISSTETKLPALVRIVPGSIRDVQTLRISVEDIGIEKITFIMDRAYSLKIM